MRFRRRANLTTLKTTFLSQSDKHHVARRLKKSAVTPKSHLENRQVHATPLYTFRNKGLMQYHNQELFFLLFSLLPSNLGFKYLNKLATAVS